MGAGARGGDWLQVVKTRPSRLWKDWSEGAEEMAVRRRFRSEDEPSGELRRGQHCPPPTLTDVTKTRCVYTDRNKRHASRLSAIQCLQRGPEPGDLSANASGFV